MADMADTRCANPEYQLEIDVMILEYLLYQTIAAQLAVSTTELSDDEREHDMVDEDVCQDDRKAEAERLLIMFDSFIQMFKDRHPSHTFKAGTEFNLALLELLVMPGLYSQLADTSPSNSTSDHGIRCAPSLFHSIETEMSRNLQARIRWLKSRETHCNAAQNHSPQVENEITQTWTWFQQQQQQLLGSLHTSTPLFDMLPRFMALSAEIVPVMGEINDNWMQLASEFMLQAALDVLQVSCSLQRTPRLPTEMEAPRRPGLAECFAWGFICNLPPISEHSSSTTLEEVKANETTHFINEMFRAKEQPAQSQEENPDWNAIRYAHLSEFHLNHHKPSNPDNLSFSSSFSSSSAPQDQSNPQLHSHTTRLRRLRAKYPIAAFQSNLRRFLEHIWLLNCSEDVSGKPVLVQIEEGNLEGLGSGEEFQGFLERVGLSRDRLSGGGATHRISSNSGADGDDDDVVGGGGVGGRMDLKL